MNMMKLKLGLTPLLATATLLLPLSAVAQNEGLLPTQTLVRADSKQNIIPDASAITLQLNGKSTPLTSLQLVPPSGVQVALLIDDGLSRSAGIQLNDLRGFAEDMPPGVEVFVGYMRNGTVEQVVPFTTDHAQAAAAVRLPLGSPGISASPYFCLSEFVRHWPGAGSNFGDRGPAENDGAPGAQKARFVIMVTNGVDPYNGSTSILNQDSPYVASAAVDAERAGVSVSSVYYSDAGFRGRGSFSGQSYLSQIADATGGTEYNMGPINPVSLKPYFDQFAHDLSETYVATFNADAGKGGKEHLVRLKMNTSIPKLKLRYPENVRPGNLESSMPLQAAK
jgi:hypothetical protein